MKNVTPYVVSILVATVGTLVGLWAYDQLNKPKVAKPATTTA